MPETEEQAKRRFAEKDRIFAERQKTGDWPIKKCNECEYVACTECGASPLLPNATKCFKCGAPTRIGHICCRRHHHHVGDCCTHCGNDERKL